MLSCNWFYDEHPYPTLECICPTSRTTSHGNRTSTHAGLPNKPCSNPTKPKPSLTRPLGKLRFRKREPTPDITERLPHHEKTTRLCSRRSPSSLWDTVQATIARTPFGSPRMSASGRNTIFQVKCYLPDKVGVNTRPTTPPAAGFSFRSSASPILAPIIATSPLSSRPYTDTPTASRMAASTVSPCPRTSGHLARGGLRFRIQTAAGTRGAPQSCHARACTSLRRRAFDALPSARILRPVPFHNGGTELSCSHAATDPSLQQSSRFGIARLWSSVVMYPSIALQLSQAVIL